MEALGLAPSAPPPRPDNRPPRTTSSATPRYTQNTLPPVVPPDDIITACLRVLTSLLGLDVSSKLDLLRKHVLEVLSATNKEDHRSVTHPIAYSPDRGKSSIVNPTYSTVEDPASDSDSVMSVQNYEETRKRKTQSKSDEVSVSSKLLSQSKAHFKASCECGLGYNPNPGWRNHLKSCTVENPIVTCWCGKYAAMSAEGSSRWIRLNNHLSKCPGSEPCN